MIDFVDTLPDRSPASLRVLVPYLVSHFSNLADHLHAQERGRIGELLLHD